MSSSRRSVLQRFGADGRWAGGPGFLGCLGLLVVTIIASTGGGLLFLSRSSPAETPSPVVLFVDKGTVGLELPGTLDFKPAGTGTVLHRGDTVHVDAGSSASLTFADGSRARLGPGAALIVRAAWMTAKGAISTASLGHLRGRILYSIVKAAGGDFEITTNAVTYEVRNAVFEVEVNAHSLETVKVFEGEISTHAGATTNFKGGATIAAGQQQMFDDIAGPLAPVEALEAYPSDPFLPIQRAEAAAAAIESTRGTEQTFSSLEPLGPGQTVTAGEYYTGGGDVMAFLSAQGSELQLAITAPGGLVYRTQGRAPLTVRIPAGPPGPYRAEVTGINVRDGGEPYAVTFSVANACHAAEGDGYLRKVRHATDLARSVRIAQLSDVRVLPVTRSGPVLIESTAKLNGGRVGVTTLIYATPPIGQVLLLSLKLQGVPLPTRAAGTVSASQVMALNVGFKIDRIYACTGGFAMEGRST